MPRPNRGTAAAAAAKSLQSCPTLCDPIDGSPARLPVPGILQARILEWVAISISNAWKWKVKSESEVAQSCPTLATPWTAAYQAPPSMGFSRQKCWSGVPLPSPTEAQWSVFLLFSFSVGCFEFYFVIQQGLTVMFKLTWMNLFLYWLI